MFKTTDRYFKITIAYFDFDSFFEKEELYIRTGDRGAYHFKAKYVNFSVNIHKRELTPEVHWYITGKDKSITASVNIERISTLLGDLHKMQTDGNAPIVQE